MGTVQLIHQSVHIKQAQATKANERLGKSLQKRSTVSIGTCIPASIQTAQMTCTPAINCEKCYFILMHTLFSIAGDAVALDQRAGASCWNAGRVLEAKASGGSQSACVCYISIRGNYFLGLLFPTYLIRNNL